MRSMAQIAATVCDLTGIGGDIAAIGLGNIAFQAIVPEHATSRFSKSLKTVFAAGKLTVLSATAVAPQGLDCSVVYSRWRHGLAHRAREAGR